MKDTTRWQKETLGLTIKSAWDIIHFASFDAERQQNKRRKAGSHQRTPGLDMMGYVVRRTYTIIRGRNFVKLRRQSCVPSAIWMLWGMCRGGEHSAL